MGQVLPFLRGRGRGWPGTRAQVDGGADQLDGAQRRMLDRDCATKNCSKEAVQELKELSSKLNP